MFSTSEIPHAVIPLPRPQVHARHPYRNEASHEQLLAYLQARLTIGKERRDSNLPRMVRTDKNVSGWIRLSDEDKKRQHKQEVDGIPQALTVNLPLNYVQLDDMMTYYSQTFAPNRGMFYQMGKPDEVNASTQIVTLMNNHAIYSGAYRQVLMTIYSILKYNLGGFEAYWSKDTGPKLARNDRDEVVLSQETVWQGNKIESLDMYNTFMDPSVDPQNVHKDGEWVAKARIVSHYWLQTRAATGMYYNVEEALKTDTGISSCTYYRSPPAEANMEADDSTGSKTNWISILSASPNYAIKSGFELATIYIKLNPWQMNLVEQTKKNAGRNRLEIWRFTILDNRTIIEAEYMNNIHGYLPFFFGMLNDDSMGTSQKSSAEILQPLQDFASFLMNTHIQSTRKNIWGLTVYDPTVVDLGSIPAGEVSARVPVKAAGQGKPVKDSIYEHQTLLDTKQTMQDLNSVIAIINQFFPATALPSQIADIDRAVNSQVAAVQQGANRRLQKGARLLDDTLFRPLRFLLYYNIIQYQPDGVDVADFYGRPQKIDLTALRETDLPYIIGQGLKAIDRMAAANQMQNIIFALIQNPATAQQVDLLAMIDYWTSMIDIDIDMKQFRVQPAQGPGAGIGDNGGPPLDPNAEVIDPGVDPMAMTEMLRGGS